ncbi:Wiskott-Aldrich syndrome protein [Toxocara canis]|uniref:Wiskott-Aldrich syndrome protein n=1 Tax=Toxocara canis TaxID=6265 RepID=A0A0B2V8K4_TOXCA|nr:Wiskott-Aldrich syndrome protein [Toxocara canis]
MQRQNVPSSLIADDVNNEIFALLGDKAFTLATGFAEIFTENETHDDWLRLGAGVICYVRDYSQRNVTLRIFDTNGGVREIWSTLVYVTVLSMPSSDCRLFEWIGMIHTNSVNGSCRLFHGFQTHA